MADKTECRSQCWRWTLSAALTAILGWSVQPARVDAQGSNSVKPVAAADYDKSGQGLFRANCSGCHGLDGRGGGQGPDLTSRPVVHGSDAALIQIITKGVPGTAMPANEDLTDSEASLIVGYLHKLTAGAHTVVTGNRERGKAIFFGKAKCTSCHMVNGQGGRLGPDLSGVGTTRSVTYLIESIREPSKELSQGLEQLYSQFKSPAVYDTVTVETQRRPYVCWRGQG